MFIDWGGDCELRLFIKIKIDCLIRAEAQGEAGPLFSIIISLGPRGKGGPPERRGEGRRT